MQDNDNIISDDNIDINYNNDNVDINSTRHDSKNFDDENLNDEQNFSSKEIEKLKEEIAESKDKYIRLLAEFDNSKRRNAKERNELIQTAGKDVVISMLDVADDCDRAEKQINNSKDINQIKEGVQLVFNKLRNTLHANGLKAMESIGTDFDVEKHEAITELEVSDKSKKGKVIDEIVKGYYLNDKLIRFAKVIVGK